MDTPVLLQEGSTSVLLLDVPWESLLSLERFSPNKINVNTSHGVFALKNCACYNCANCANLEVIKADVRDSKSF